MKRLMIRFNTENQGKLFWRVVVDGVEHLADSVTLYQPSSTSEDTLPDGKKKFHITCWYNRLTWNGTNLIVE